MAGIPFVREMDPKYGEVASVSPLIRRVVCENPGPFTFLGTGVYIVGKPGGDVAVIDPGPLDETHLEKLKAALRGDRVSHVIVTHTHADHSPLAHPLAKWAGAKVYGSAVVPVADHGPRLEEDGDDHFRPDLAVSDGDVLRGAGWTLEAIATPGHMSNHICYALKEENVLFSGDHVMGWSTTVISPPDGNMADYFASLRKVRERGFQTLWPTHGPPIRDVAPFLDAYQAHRLAREAAIAERLRAGDTRIIDMVKVIYKDVDSRLHPAAAHSVLAHMIHLVEQGRVKADGPLTVAGSYRLA